MGDAGVRADSSRRSRRSTSATRSRRRAPAERPLPTLLAWAPDDLMFPLSFAERLAAMIPGARLEQIADSRAFVPEDQPQRLAELVAAFVGELQEASSTRSRR